MPIDTCLIQGCSKMLIHRLILWWEIFMFYEENFRKNVFFSFKKTKKIKLLPFFWRLIFELNRWQSLYIGKLITCVLARGTFQGRIIWRRDDMNFLFLDRNKDENDMVQIQLGFFGVQTFTSWLLGTTH